MVHPATLLHVQRGEVHQDSEGQFRQERVYPGVFRHGLLVVAGRAAMARQRPHSQSSHCHLQRNIQTHFRTVSLAQVNSKPNCN